MRTQIFHSPVWVLGIVQLTALVLWLVLQSFILCMYSLILWQRWRRTTCDWWSYFSESPHPLQHSALQILVTSVSPNFNFYFLNLARLPSSTWVNLPYSAVQNIPLGRKPGYQRPVLPIIQYLKTVILCLLCTCLVLNGERLSLVPVISSGPKS